MSTGRSSESTIATLRARDRPAGAGLEVQRAAIVDAVERREWDLVAIAEDAGVSAGQSPQDRPGFGSVLAAIDSDEATGVVVSKLDRLTRSLPDFTRLLEQANRDDWTVTALDVDVDTSTATGKLVAHIMGAVSEWERGIVSERTKAALAVKRAQGNRLGRPLSLPQQVRDRLQAERCDDRTLASIADGLNRDGVPTTQGGARWWPATVRAVLQSLGLDSQTA